MLLLFSQIIAFIILFKCLRRLLVTYSPLSPMLSKVVNSHHINLQEQAAQGEKWALVTGASSGIGKEFSKELARKGFNLILVARRKELLQIFCDELEEDYHVRAKFIVLDLSTLTTNLENLKTFATKVEGMTSNQGLSVLVCNASFALLARNFIDIELERNMKLINLAIATNVALIQTFLPSLLSSKGKSVVITLGALNAFHPSPSLLLSGATKTFMRFFTRSLRQEMIGSTKQKIIFHMVHPIAVKSDIVSSGSDYDLLTKYVLISPKVLVKRSFKSMEQGEPESFGGLAAEMWVNAMILSEALFGEAVVAAWFREDIGRFSTMLNVDIDQRSLDQKMIKLKSN